MIIEVPACPYESLDVLSSCFQRKESSSSNFISQDLASTQPHSFVQFSQVNVVDLDGRTPLRICAELGHSQIAELLLNDANADVNLVDGSGRSPLWMAACYGRLKVMMALVAAQADVQKVGNWEFFCVFKGFYIESDWV